MKLAESALRVVLWFCLLPLPWAEAFAGPQLMNYQGKLTDSNGNPVTTPPGPGRIRLLAAAVLLAAAALALYGRSLRYRFLCDDTSFIRDNPSIRSLAASGRFFLDPSTLAADRQLARDNWPGGPAGTRELALAGYCLALVGLSVVFNLVWFRFYLDEA